MANALEIALIFEHHLNNSLLFTFKQTPWILPLNTYLELGQLKKNENRNCPNLSLLSAS
jgi:hypothetical protein